MYNYNILQHSHTINSYNFLQYTTVTVIENFNSFSINSVKFKYGTKITFYIFKIKYDLKYKNLDT